MNLLTAKPMPGTCVFHGWVEARDLWDRLVVGLPGCLAMVLLPGAAQVLHPRATEVAFRRLLGDFARWRNARRGERGPVWERPVPRATRAASSVETAAMVRAIHDSPLCAGLASDPLEWPFSTCREAARVALPAAPAALPRRLATAASLDETGLPVGLDREPTPHEIVRAVSALTRTPISGLARRGSPRTLLVRALWELTRASAREVADFAGVSTRQVQRLAVSPDPAVGAVARVVGDPRFAGLADGDLRPLWASRGWRP